MHNPDIECRVDFTDRGKLIKEKTDPLIVKYCELSSKHHFQINLNYKSIQCVDCGEWFDVLTKNNNTCRCPDCYEEYRKNRKLETQRARRNKMKSGQKIL